MNLGAHVTHKDGSWDRSYQVYRVMKTKLWLWLGSPYEHHFVVERRDMILSDSTKLKHNEICASFRNYLRMPESGWVHTDKKATQPTEPVERSVNQEGAGLRFDYRPNMFDQVLRSMRRSFASYQRDFNPYRHYVLEPMALPEREDNACSESPWIGVNPAILPTAVQPPAEVPPTPAPFTPTLMGDAAL